MLERSMPAKIRIALDAMGGDHGPSVVIPGAAISLVRHPDLAFGFYGDEAVIRLDRAISKAWRIAPT